VDVGNVLVCGICWNWFPIPARGISTAAKGIENASARVPMSGC